MQLTAKRARELSEQARVVGIHIELIEQEIMEAVHEGRISADIFVPALNAGDELALVESALKGAGYVITGAIPHTPPEPLPGQSRMSPGTKLSIGWAEGK